MVSDILQERDYGGLFIILEQPIKFILRAIVDFYISKACFVCEAHAGTTAGMKWCLLSCSHLCRICYIFDRIPCCSIFVCIK